MNKLSIEKQILILQSLCEGNSIRSIERITNTHRDTIMRLLVSAGQKAQEIMDNTLVNLKCNEIQCDEIWTFVGKGDIRTRLLAHLNGDNPCIIQNKPTHFVGEVLTVDPSEREKELIIELNPSCNKKIG